MKTKMNVARVGSGRIVGMRRAQCPRCKGKGYRVLIVGPHINDIGAVCGGPARYICRMCDGTGKHPNTKITHAEKNHE